MVDWYDLLFMLAVVALVLMLPKISPCVGCVVADGEMSMEPGGDHDCRKECQAFIHYSKSVGRQDS